MKKGERFFIAFANDPSVKIAHEEHQKLLKKGESAESYLKERKESNDLRYEIALTLPTLLDRFIKDKKIKKSKELNFFFNLFLKRPLNPIKYEITSKKGISEIYYTKSDNLGNVGLIDTLLTDLKMFLIYDYENIPKLKKCFLCKKYYVAERNNPHQKYCPICSQKNKMTREERKQYQKSYRANPARQKVITKRKHEKRIQRMIEGGYTRKQAENMINNEV